MKTGFLREYIKRIEALNDQLWYFVFTSEELIKQLEKFSLKAKDCYVIDLFNDNIYSKRIHIKAVNLQEHQNSNKKFTFGSYFSTCYEISSNYIKNIFDSLKDTNNLTRYNWTSQIPPEENLKKLISNSGLILPPDYIFDTITYLRLLRNHFTHIITSPNTKLSTVIRNKGLSLNLKWKTSGVVNSIDFNSLLNVTDFGQEQTIELIKILRICLIDLDTEIASLLDVNGTIKTLVQSSFGHENVRMNSEIKRDRSKKIIKIAKSRLGLIVNELQVIPYVTKIGTK